MFLVFVYRMIRQVWPQEETERLRNTDFLYSQVLETGGKAHRLGHMEKHQVVRRKTEELAKTFGPGLH